MEAHSSASAATSKAPASAAAAASSAVQDSGAPKTFFCYLLHSLADPSKGHTYIGFTVNPLRRLKQHNGTLRAGGASHTARKRPWTMVAVVHGFPTKIAALQFEWAWQYPRASRLVRGLLEREDATHPEGRGSAPRGGGRSRRTKLYGTRPRGQLNLLYAMLSLQPWCHYALHVRYLRQDDYDTFHASNRSGVCVEPALRAGLPRHVDVSVGPLEQLEWASTLTKTARKAAQARGQGDTPGAGEAIFLDVPPSSGPGKNAAPPASAAAAAGSNRGGGAGAGAGGAAAMADGAYDDDVDVELELELEAEETEHEVVLDDADQLGYAGPDRAPSDEDDFSLSPPQPASAAAAQAAKARALALEEQERSDRAFAQALARAEYGYDSFDHDTGAHRGTHETGAAFRFDVASNSFVLVGEEEDEVDLTHLGALGAVSAASATAAAAAAISTPAASASSSSSSSAAAIAAIGGVLSSDPACALCERAPAGAQPVVPQLSQFGFHKLMSVCPYCSATAHLLCFQRRMQQQHPHRSRNTPLAGSSASTSASASAASPGPGSDLSPSLAPAPEVPLLPAPAPCPFCERTLAWCMLVENSHRYHAPTSATTAASSSSLSAAAAAPAAVAPRTLGEYFLDAGAQFSRIARLQMMQQWRETQAAKAAAKVAAVAAAAAKKLRAKAKGGASSSSVTSSPAPAPAPVPASVLISSPTAAMVVRIGGGHTPNAARREYGENKENFPSSGAVGSVVVASAVADAADALGASVSGARKTVRKRRSRSISPARAHALAQGAGSSLHAARGESPSAAMAQLDPALAKKPKRCATPAAAAAAVAHMPQGPLRSLSLPMMQADNLVVAPASSSESITKRAALARAARVAAAASSLHCVPVATEEDQEEDGGFDPARWCGSQPRSHSQSLRIAGGGSQRSGGDASEGSEIDLTEVPSLWDRCSAAAPPNPHPARPHRSANGAARVASTSTSISRAPPLSPIRIEDSDCDSVESGSPTKRSVAPRSRPHPVAAPTTAAAASSKPHKNPTANAEEDEVGLMERLKNKYGLEQIVLSL